MRYYLASSQKHKRVLSSSILSRESSHYSPPHFSALFHESLPLLFSLEASNHPARPLFIRFPTSFLFLESYAYFPSNLSPSPIFLKADPITSPLCLAVLLLQSPPTTFPNLDTFSSLPRFAPNLRSYLLRLPGIGKPFNPSLILRSPPPA